MLNSWHWCPAFLTFSWKSIKNDIGCCTGVSLLHGKPDENDIGCFMWVSSLWHFHGKIEIETISDGQLVTFGYRAVFWHFHEKIQKKMNLGCRIYEIWVSSFFHNFMQKWMKNVGCNSWLGYRTVFDILKKSIFKLHRMLNSWDVGIEPFDILIEKSIKHGIGCLIHDIWVPSLFWQIFWTIFRHDIGCWIDDVGVRAFFDIFLEKARTINIRCLIHGIGTKLWLAT